MTLDTTRRANPTPPRGAASGPFPAPNMTSVMGVSSGPSSTTPNAALAEVPETARLALVSVGRDVSFAAGAIVLREGSIADGFYLLRAGQMKMSRLTPAGRTLVLALCGPGELFGVTPALGGSPCTSAWEAVTDVDCVEVRRIDFYALLESRPELAPVLLPYLTRNLAECGNCLVEAACARVEHRFALLFLKLVDKMGRLDDRGSFIPLHLSRQDLADLAGTTLETSIRVMSRWGKEKIVETRNDGFMVPNPWVLETMLWGRH
jgi:CRP-like cAMP-binding protein